MTRIDLPFERIEKFIRDRIVVTSTGCWEWTGTRNEQGYGRAWLDGSHKAAHRLAAHLWINDFAYGDFPLMVCHRCDNPPCVNPDHLFIGSAHDNMSDAASKGRLPGVPGPRPDLLIHPRERACVTCGVTYAPDPNHRGRSIACSLACGKASGANKRRGKGLTITPAMAAEVKSLLAAGWTGKAVAEHLAISRASVSHIKNGKRVITR